MADITIQGQYSATLDGTTAADDNITIINSTITNAFTTQAGNDSLTITGSRLNGTADLGADNDTLNAANSTLNGVVSMGAGNDSFSGDSVTLGNRLDGGAGDNAFTLNNSSSGSWVNLGTSADADATLSITNSSVTGIRATANVTNSLSNTEINSYNIDATDSTITQGIQLDSSSGGSVNLDSVSVISRGVNIVGTNSDTINISSSTIDGVVNGGDGGDTLVITDSSLTSAGNVINISDNLADGSGDNVSLSNVTMGGNINIGTTRDAYSINIENSSLRGVIDQNQVNGGTVSITNSTISSVVLDQGNAGHSLDLTGTSVSGGAIGGGNFLTTGLGNDTINLQDSTINMTNHIRAGSGNDRLDISSNTSLLTQNAGPNNALAGDAGTDTLAVSGPWTITLRSPVVVDDGSGPVTTSIISSDNFDNVVSGPSPGNYDGTLSLGDSSTTVRLSSWETLESIPCFGRGTLIETDRGQLPIEDLRIGDLVQTIDAGLQPIRWIGSRKLSILDILTSPHLIPIRVAKGALGAGLPESELILSPQHRVLVQGKVVQRMFDCDEVLVAIKHLTVFNGVTSATDMQGVEYYHLMLDEHHIISANGMPSESLYAGRQALNSLEEEAQAEIFALFPELAEPVSAKPAKPARHLIPGRLAQNLADRMQRNGHELLLTTFSSNQSEIA